MPAQSSLGTIDDAVWQQTNGLVVVVYIYCCVRHVKWNLFKIRGNKCNEIRKSKKKKKKKKEVENENQPKRYVRNKINP